MLLVTWKSLGCRVALTELMIPLLTEDGDRILSMLIPDRMESPQWEKGSHEEEGF